MGEVAVKLIDTIEIGTRALSVVDQAKALVVIKDAEHYLRAGELWKVVVAMMKEVDEAFDHNIKRWHEGHKSAIADKARYWNPLNDTKKTIKIVMEKYDAEQERIRVAEQRRLEEIARKEEEERRLAEAIAAEEELKARGATKEEAAKEATAIIEEPVSVAPVIIPKATPKLAGGPVYRTIWKARIIDERKIPRQYLVPDIVKINQVVRALKNNHGIDGIEAYEERV